MAYQTLYVIYCQIMYIHIWFVDEYILGNIIFKIKTTRTIFV